MAVKILISGYDRSLFNNVKYGGTIGMCLTTTESLCGFEGFRTEFITKREFYTTIMDITPTDFETLPDVNLFHSLGTEGELVRKCRLIKPHILIYSKGDKLERLLEADIKVELSRFKQIFNTEYKNIVIRYSTYFNERIDILPEMFEDDNLIDRFNSDSSRAMRLNRRYTYEDIIGTFKRMRDSCISGEWYFPKHERNLDVISEVMQVMSKRVISTLLLEKILTVAITSINKPSMSARIDAIIAELLELKKELN
jgi:hypothetical protein